MYLALGPTLMARRAFGCWCRACRARVFDAAGACPAAGCGRAMCQWEEQTVQPLDVPAVARTRTAAQAEGKKLARKLQIGQWLAAQVRVRRAAGHASHAGAAEGSVEERWLARSTGLVALPMADAEKARSSRSWSARRCSRARTTLLVTLRLRLSGMNALRPTRKACTSKRWD